MINDFVAQAAAIPGLGEDDLWPLKPGLAKLGRPGVVIGPGTGLGVAFRIHEGGATRILPSEAGHCSFAPQDDEQAEILHRARQELGHVSTERLLSGPGLVRIANGLAAGRGTALRFAVPRQVTQRAADQACPVSLAAIRMFCAVLGATAGDLALVLLADGGVHVTGGLCRALGPLLDRAALREGFAAKSRYAAYLQDIPIIQVMRPHSGLLGATLYRSEKVHASFA